ncbi:MAG TPA: (Fe-S)-binding protein [bacterium (Candidatus Stahlbacteria)]|nr:(Fe-S)-binding protein [Candidatus Stahlbacteria bacterium]
MKEVCCGYPMEALGFRDEFEEHKKKVKELFPYNEAITLCPTCTAYFKEEYGIDAKHITQVLVEKMPKADLGITATYHDPCDLSRAISITEEPRQLLERIGVKLVEMKKARNLSQCCGGGGGILAYDVDMSDRVARNRIEQAKATGASVLTTACATCEQVLKKASKGDIQVRNISDLIWKALKKT